LQKSKEKNRAQAVTLLKENLSEHEWFILRGRFCFDTDEPIPFRTIGATLGLSHDNIHKKQRSLWERHGEYFLAISSPAKVFFRLVLTSLVPCEPRVFFLKNM
jgi:hypothetical protein